MNLVDKLKSRKLWVMLAYVLLAAVSPELAKEVAPVVFGYLGAQGLADLGLSYNSKK